MPQTKSVTGSLVVPLELRQPPTKSLVLSSRQLGWNGILVEQYQHFPTSTPTEVKNPALSDHWLIFPLGHPATLFHKLDNGWHESVLQKGDITLVPAGQPSAWRYPGANTRHSELQLHIWLKPKLIEQAAEVSEIDRSRLDLVNCFGQQDLQLHHVAMLLLAELQVDGIMGRLYVESLTQALVIHLLRHYSTFRQPTTFESRSLTYTPFQQAIEYIHAHLDRELSLAEIAGVVNISPTYFANLFKHATGISPHQYVIQQRVEQAKLLLLTTELSIANIALQVGFSNQSHLTQHFKRLTGVTPKQVR